MASPTPPSSDDLPGSIKNASSLLQWRSDVGDVGRLGCAFPTQACRVFSHIGFDDSQQTGLFRISVPVALKNAGDNRKSVLYIYIDPEHISHLQRLPLDDGETTQLGVSALVSHARECTSPDDIIALQFLLKQHVTIVGVKGTVSLTPKSKAAGKILESLRSLSLATNITVYLPNNGTLSRHVDGLCASATRGSLTALQRHTFDTLYGGAGGVDIGNLLARFGHGSIQNPETHPPPYDDLSPTAEPKPSLPRKRKSDLCNCLLRSCVSFRRQHFHLLCRANNLVVCCVVLFHSAYKLCTRTCAE
ncbi:hypothetical protein MPH_09215 [Macrophomina phaseolina MS6]|uniref:Uncharacterized protein n=1 Tax=Macrophomina phaseolina (strain MS6) TaxID=1126212 RepID=K2RGA0_MACPH|nr:hypothetical protein MPH_09215 [Macrophomina phaseolina MS6]